MQFANLELQDTGHISTVTINRADALNALNEAVLLQLEAAFTQLELQKETRVVVITGTGRAFVAGGDIRAMAAMDASEGRAYVMLGQRVLAAIENSRLPIIAAVNGFALGGGCELALACDIRLAAEGAVFGQPEVGLGIVPGFGGSQRLARICGPGLAKELILTGRTIDAREAYRIGLVTTVSPDEELMAQAYKLAAIIAAKSPIAVANAKHVIAMGYNADFQTGCQLEVEAFTRCMAHPDAHEGLQARLDKRAPHWIS